MGSTPPKNDLASRIERLENEIYRLQHRTTLRNASISGGDLRVKGGGNIQVLEGGDIVISGGGGIRIEDSGNFALTDGGNITIDNGGNLRVIEGGDIRVEGGSIVLTEEGDFRIEGGNIRVVDDSGNIHTYLGEIFTDGTFAGRGILVLQSDGTAIASFRSDTDIGATSEIYDPNGNAIIETDKSGNGFGLFRPHMHYPLYMNDIDKGYYHTDSTSWVTAFSGAISFNHPFFHARLSVITGGTVGRVRVRIRDENNNYVIRGGPTEFSSSQVINYPSGTLHNVAGAYPGATSLFQVQIRVVSGSSTVAVRPEFLAGHGES